MATASTEFQRARRPDQIELRRSTILATARTMLREHPIAEVSLRELSERVGLAKSNVLRYFDSREAIFLEVLDQEWSAWLAALEAEGSPVQPGIEPAGFAAAVTTSLLDRELLCELLASMAGVLERNIGIDYARDFKARAADHTEHLARIVHRTFPTLDAAECAHYAGAIVVILAGLWPYARPSDVVAQVSAEMGVAPGIERFEREYTAGLTVHLHGLLALHRN